MRQQTIVERLDFVAKRIPGLKFTPPTLLKPGDDQCYGCFMSCDMFYIEIKVDQSHQTVKDVIISHGISAEGISCPVLTEVLADQDFETFAKHLSGLHSIYQIGTNDKKVKQRAYPALLAIETDLAILYDHQRRRTSNCHELVHKSPIGFMEPRKGGLPVRLTYFVTPHDLVDTTNKTLINLTMNNIVEKNLGLSATVEIESSSNHKLQIRSLISNQLNSTLPAYAPFNNQNSEKLPAQFILNLSQPLPILNSTIHQILNELNSEPATIKEYLTNLSTVCKESLISLIARQELDLNRGPFGRTLDTLKNVDNESCDLARHVYSIQLLDQCHTYYISDSYLERQDGVYLTKVPFTHPTSIPNILRVLRQQALFNFVIGSCIRRNRSNSNNIEALKNSQDVNIFDVVPVSLTSLCVSFEHPSKESLATLEIDLKDSSCKLHALEKGSVCSNDYATKILQKCWSLPITLRSVLKKCKERRLALLEDASKRRERELQDFLATTTTTTTSISSDTKISSDSVLAPALQAKANNQNQDKSSIAQSKTTNDITKVQKCINLPDINQFGDTSSKVNYLANNNNQSQHHVFNQTQNELSNDDLSNRSNLLKKYSCKPKAKQNVTAKKQSGTNILSIMLKRPNSTSSSAEDANLKATLTKKPKIKATPVNESTNERPRYSALPIASGPMTGTKLMSSEEAAAAAVAVAVKQQQFVKPSKQAATNLTNSNESLSLIRPQKKNLQHSIISAQNSSILVNTVNASNQSSGPSSASVGPTGIKREPSIQFSPFPTGAASVRTAKLLSGPLVDSHPNNNNATGYNNNSKVRKSSVGAVLDTLVGNVAPGEQASSSQAPQIQDGNLDGSKSSDSKGSPLNTKSKARAPSNHNQFAIKHGSPSGLKLTLKSTNSIASSSSPSITSLSTSSSNFSSSSQSQANSSLTSSTSNKVSSSAKSNLNTLLNIQNNRSLNSYTIPKKSKTQPQASQSDTNQVSSTESQASASAKPGDITPSRLPLPVTLQAPPPQPVPTPGPASVPMPSVSVPVFLPTDLNRLSNGPTDNGISSSTKPPSMRKNPLLNNPSGQGVSSSSDGEFPRELGPSISTPSSPTECGQAETVAPPPMIPIDSLYEQQPTSPEPDQLPDDESDRLSIIDANENMMDSTSDL